MKCPVCDKETYEEKELEYDIPHLGKFKIITGKCNSCNYKYNSIISLEKGNQKFISKEINKKTLNDIVVRSPYCKISIPELGLEILPGERCEGFITTIEGVLQRFLNIVEFLEKGSENKMKYKEIKKKLLDLIEGKSTATIILEDKEGLSKIVKNENFDWGEGHSKCNTSRT